MNQLFNQQFSSVAWVTEVRLVCRIIEGLDYIHFSTFCNVGNIKNHTKFPIR